jgi:predicted transcriptional regulator
MVLGVLGAAGMGGLTAQGLADALDVSRSRIYTHVQVLQRQGLVRRHGQRQEGGAWHRVFIRSDALLTHPDTGVIFAK